MIDDDDDQGYELQRSRTPPHEGSGSNSTDYFGTEAGYSSDHDDLHSSNRHSIQQQSLFSLLESSAHDDGDHPHHEALSPAVQEKIIASFVPADLRAALRHQEHDSLAGRLLEAACREIFELRQRVRRSEEVAEQANIQVSQLLEDFDSARQPSWETRYLELHERYDRLKVNLVKLTAKNDSLMRTQTTLGLFGAPVGQQQQDDGDFPGERDDGDDPSAQEEPRKAHLTAHDVFNDIAALLDTMESSLQITRGQRGDVGLLQAFLEQLRDQKREELEKVKQDIGTIEADLDRVSDIVRQDTARAGQARGQASNPFGSAGGDYTDEEDDDPLGPSSSSSSSSSSSRAKRSDPLASQVAFGDDRQGPRVRLAANSKRQKVVNQNMSHFKDKYFSARHASQNASSHNNNNNNNYSSSSSSSHDNPVDALYQLSETFSSLSSFTGLEALATFRYGASAARQTYANGKVSNAVSCIRFRRDDEYVSIAGMAEIIQIYSYDTLLQHGDDQASLAPLDILHAGDKIYSTSWDPFDMAQAAAAGGSGSVSLWDVGQKKVVRTFSEHRQRAWSVSHSKLQRSVLASSSDDGTVKVWHLTQPQSTLTLRAPDSVGCVEFNPIMDNQLAFSCADNNVYYYDIREPSEPVHVLRGHRHSVTNVAFWKASAILSQSFDETIKLWELDRPRPSCVRTFEGFQQKKNSTGFSIASNGYIACGSEDNAVYVYSTESSKPLFNHTFNTTLFEDDQGACVSATCWKQNANVLLAANSKGIVKVLGLIKS